MVCFSRLLTVIRDRLESLLHIQNNTAERFVALSGPGELDGDSTEGITNKILLSLVSIQSDPVYSSFAPPRLGGDNNYVIPNPRLILDGYILITPNFRGTNYPDGLKMFSQVISYLQESPVLTPAEVPDLPEECSRLAIEFVSLDFAQSSNLITFTGIKCFPFAVYRLRGLPFDGPAFAGTAGPVRAAEPQPFVGGPS